MRVYAVAFLLAALCSGLAQAQTTPSPAPSPMLEGVTLGEPMHQVRDALGDPVQFLSAAEKQIWRYVGRGGAVYVDVLAQNNVVYSVTVVRRFAASAYTDDAGIAFGSTSADLRAKRGSPSRVTTNSDDGSIDLWYVDPQVARIYEFYGDKLGFVQILPSPQLRSTFAAADAAAPAGGTSVADAIRIRPSNLLGNSAWIDAYLAMNVCGAKGHWKLTSSKMQSDPATNDLLAYTTVHAQCTEGGSERDFVFDTHGMITKTGPNGSQNTIYIDTTQMQEHPQPSPSPTPGPR